MPTRHALLDTKIFTTLLGDLMRPSFHAPTAVRARLAIAGIAAAGLVTSAVAVATPASAAGLNLLASATTLSGHLAESGTTITLTATVSLGKKPGTLNLGPITPAGAVTFSDDLHDNLGAVTLPSCLLTTCTVTRVVQVSSLSSGITKLTASYPGDTILKPSSASIAAGFSTCSDDDCGFEIASSSTQFDVGSAGDGYLVGTLGGSALPCSVGGAPVANVVGVGLDSRKLMDYRLDGAAATAYGNLSLSLERDYLCYVSPIPFTAYSNDGSTTFPKTSASFSVRGSAPLLTSGAYAGQYAGLLADCDELASDDTSPCIDIFDYYTTEGSNPHPEVFISLNAPPGDPHMGG